MRPSGIIYGLDGTLVDSGGNITAATNVARAHFGLPELGVEQCVRYIGHGSQRLIRRALFGQDLGGRARPDGLLDPAKVSFETAFQLFMQSYLRNAAVGLTIYDGVWEALAWWQSRGVPQAILTNKPHKVTLEVCAQLGLDAYMCAILGPGADIEGSPLPAKPDTTGMELILSRFACQGAARESVWMVGDGTPDIEVANRAGLPCIAITTGYTSRERLMAVKPPPTTVANSFRESFELLKAGLRADSASASRSGRR